MKAEHRPPKDPGSCRVKTKTPPEGSKSPQRQRPESLTSTVKRFPVCSFPVSEFSQNLWEQLCDWQPRWTHIQQTGYSTDELSLHNDTTATLDDNNNNNNSVFGTSCLKTSSSWAPWWPLQVVGGVKLSEINRNKQISIFLKKTSVMVMKGKRCRVDHCRTTFRRTTAWKQLSSDWLPFAWLPLAAVKVEKTNCKINK